MSKVGLVREMKIRSTPLSNQESQTAAGELLGQPEKSCRGGGNLMNGNPTQAWLSGNIPSHYKL